MALTVFMLIMVVSYSTLGPAGEGFLQLQKVRDSLEASSWAGRQLRTDIGMSSQSQFAKVKPLVMQSDGRGDSYFDQLWLMVREAGKPGLTYVHYYLDEDKNMLVRESKMAWARDTTDVDRMDVVQADSFQVEMMDAQGQWLSRWDGVTKTGFQWPRAIRIHLQSHHKMRLWVIAMPLGLN